MFRLAWGTLTTTALSICMMLSWVGGAAAVTPISACGTTLTVSGGYVLTGNLSSPDLNDCITVAADNVTIDFSGFVIEGAGSGSGVTDNGASHKSIVVRNGTIRGKADGTGIDLSSSTDVVVDGMVLTGNGSGAVVFQGVVRNSIMYDNIALGVSFGDSSSLLDSTIYNSGAAVLANGHITVARNTFSQNVNVTGGAFMIALVDHASVTDNTVINNSAPHPTVSVGAFALVARNTVINNSASGHPTVSVGASSLVARNTVLHNTGTFGIAAGPRSTVKDNVANANTATGILVDAKSDVIGNTAIGNGGDGIDVTCPSTVKFNTAFGNTGTNLSEIGTGCTNVDNNAP